MQEKKKEQNKNNKKIIGRCSVKNNTIKRLDE
jgi:hypothetical protein